MSDWLKAKYPAAPHLQISYSALQNYKAQYLGIKGRVLQDIKDAGKATREAIRHQVKQEQVEATSAYQEAIQAIAEEKLDVQRELVEIFHILKNRVEHFYNTLQTQDFSHNQEKSFQKYLDQMMSALENYKKYVEGHSETIDHNINVNIMTDQVSRVREAVREVLVDMDPELAVQFMGKLNEKMRELDYKPPDSLPVSNFEVE